MQTLGLRETNNINRIITISQRIRCIAYMIRDLELGQSGQVWSDKMNNYTNRDHIK